MKDIKNFIVEGSWGYEPLAGDSGLDLRDDLINSLFVQLNKEIEEANKKRPYEKYQILWDCIGTGLFFIDKFYKEYPFIFENDEEGKFKENGEKAFEGLSSDDAKEWINAWEDPDKMRNEIKKQQKIFNDVIKKAKDAHK